MNPMLATDLFVTVSMSDLMRWQDDNNDACEPAPSLLAALKEAALTVDLRNLYFQYMDQVQVGRGDVYLYPSRNAAESLFVINMYRELTDQLDIVSFGLICNRSKAPAVAAHLYAFFQEASIQISFEHSIHCVQLHNLIDPTKYPLLIKESGYVQQIINVFASGTT